jgi:hypothetical protein
MSRSVANADGTTKPKLVVSSLRLSPAGSGVWRECIQDYMEASGSSPAQGNLQGKVLETLVARFICKFVPRMPVKLQPSTLDVAGSNPAVLTSGWVVAQG